MTARAKRELGAKLVRLMKIRELRHSAWIVLALTACGHVGLDLNSDDGADVSGDGDGDARGGEVGTGPDDSGDGDAGDGDGDGAPSGGYGGDIPQPGNGGASAGGGETGGGSASGGYGGEAAGGMSSVSSGGVDGTGGDEAAGGTDAGGSGVGGVQGTGGSLEGSACDVVGDHHFKFDSSRSYSAEGPQEGQWGLDTSYTKNSGTLSWTGSEGHLALGALKAVIVEPVLAPNPQGLYPRTALDREDLRETRVRALVYVQSGEEVSAKLFVQSEGYLWAEGSLTELQVGKWTCLELDLEQPAYADDEFDPSDIIGIGVEIARNQSSLLVTPITAYLDDVSY